MVTPEKLLSLLPAQGLFRGSGVPWRVSPEPLALPKALVRQLQGLGHVLACFQDASHRLYRRSVAGEVAPWLAPLLEKGKPAWLVAAQRSGALGNAAPRIVRPDLLWCGSGFALAELDSVPGGMGTTLFLSKLYAGEGWAVLGGAEGMAQGFAAAHPRGAWMAVSEESADYRPEMEYLADVLGEGFRCVSAETPGAGQEGCQYRFWELFDWAAIPSARSWVAASGQGSFEMSPPPVQHLEEKLWLALFHCPGLQGYWASALRGSHLQRLRRLIPHGWVVDPAPLPPQAALPWLNVHSWEEVAAFGQQSRRLVLKISGFSPLAWGGRGVLIGHDMGADEWKGALRSALADFPRSPWIMQEFCEPKLVEHPYYTGSGGLAVMRGRVRLCPYYFRAADGRTRLGGCLATITPADKKKIHGMGDAILVPCCEA